MRKKYIGCLILFSTVIAVFRATVVIFNMESQHTHSYYLRDNFQTVSFTVVAVISLIALALLAVYVGKGKRVYCDSKSNEVVASSCMLAFMLLGTVIVYIVSAINQSNVENTVMEELSVALAGASAVAILIISLGKCKSEVMAWLTLVPFFWVVLRLLNDFMNTNSAPLSSSGAYHILSLVALVLYFLCEGKGFINKSSAVMYYLFGYISVFLLLVYSLPNLLIHCLGFFAFDYYATLSPLDLVVAGYICTRLASAKITDKEIGE